MEVAEILRTLDSSNELQITVTGRKTGRKHSTPIWFVREGKAVFLLPVGGLKSQWFQNAVKSKQIRISSGNVSLDLSPKPVSDARKIGSIVDKFQKKHGERWYPTGKFMVAVELALP